MPIKTLLTLFRASNLPTIWVNVITACLLSTSNYEHLYFSVFLLTLAFSAFYCAGMCQNDYCDAQWDSQYQSFRPIPAGLITRNNVAIITAALFLIGTLFLYLLNVKGLIYSLIVVLVISVYNIIHKKTSAGLFFMAGSRFCVYIFSALLIADHINASVLLIASTQFIYTFVITGVSKYEQFRQKKEPNFNYKFPVIPIMICFMCILDSLALAFYTHNIFFITIGILGFILTRFFQKHIRGD